MAALGRVALVVGFVFVLLAAMTGCGDSRPCLRSHLENILMPMTHVGPKGAVSVTMLPTVISVCDQYGPAQK